MFERFLWLAAAMVLAGTGCDDDDATAPTSETTRFQVQVENVSMAYEFTASGAFNTPVGADMPGPIGPGDAYEFSFSAAPGSRLSFATMFVHSNDLFYGPDAAGIALFDADGLPIEGDITSEIALWDAGTEMNQEPGLGPDQAPRQAGPDSGADDPDDTVRLAADEFGNLPAVSDVLEVTLTSVSATEFTVRIENVSTNSTLMTSDGGSVAVPLAPGVWVVHPDDGPIFTTGESDRGEGLEALAEDGDPSSLADALAARTGLTVPLSPGVFAVHSTDGPIFTSGQPDRGLGLEALAEDGDPSELADALASAAGVSESGAFTTPVGAAAPGVLSPGQAYEFSVDAEPGDRLSLATMFVQSNDLFYAPAASGIELFDGTGTAISGDVTAELQLWDAGTEVNERPGVGLNQAPRQAGVDTGADENGVVRPVDDGFMYPGLTNVIRVSITPMPIN